MSQPQTTTGYSVQICSCGATVRHAYVYDPDGDTIGTPFASQDVELSKLSCWYFSSTT